MLTGKESAALPGLTGEERELYENAHESNIKKLVQLYGEAKEAEIRERYYRIRERHEGDASVPNFIPIFVGREYEETYPLIS